MIIYIVIFSCLFLIGIASIQLKISRIFSFFILLFLILFGSIRYNIGMDYESYTTIFDTIGNSPLTFSESTNFYVEPGYALLISNLKYIGFSNIHLFSLHILLSIYFVDKGLKKYSPNVFSSWLLIFGVYYVNLFFNGIRQGLYIAILFSILPDLINGGKQNILKMFVLTLLLTFFLHKTALITPIVYIICLYKPHIKKKYFILFLALIWAFSGVGNIILRLGGLTVFQESAYLGVLDMYANHESFGAEIKFLSISVFHRLAILLLALQFSDNRDNKMDKIINIYFWSVIIYFFFVPFGYIVATRLGMNLKIFDSILLPYIIVVLKDIYLKYIWYLVISIWSMAMMLTNFYIPGNYEYYIPYRTIFNIRF